MEIPKLLLIYHINTHYKLNPVLRGHFYCSRKMATICSPNLVSMKRKLIDMGEKKLTLICCHGQYPNI